MSLLPTAGDAAAALAPLQQLPGPELAGGPIGNLLVALVVIALVLFIGRYVMGVAWRILKIAIVIVGVVWLLSVVAPGLL